MKISAPRFASIYELHRNGENIPEDPKPPVYENAVPTIHAVETVQQTRKGGVVIFPACFVIYDRTNRRLLGITGLDAITFLKECAEALEDHSRRHFEALVLQKKIQLSKKFEKAAQGIIQRFQALQEPEQNVILQHILENKEAIPLEIFSTPE